MPCLQLLGSQRALGDPWCAVDDTQLMVVDEDKAAHGAAPWQQQRAKSKLQKFLRK